MEPVKITLGGKTHEIAQLDLGQLRDLSIGVVLPDVDDPKAKVLQSFTRSVDTISTALRNTGTPLTVEELFKMPITSVEMSEAVRVILRFAGLLPEAEIAKLSNGATPAGEGRAGAASSTGPG